MNQNQNDPMMGFVNGFQSFMQNPMQNSMQFMMQRNMNIPQDIANNPDKIIQHLMDSGKLSQGQYNQAKQIANRMQGNPMFQKFFKR